MRKINQKIKKKAKSKQKEKKIIEILFKLDLIRRKNKNKRWNI